MDDLANVVPLRIRRELTREELLVELRDKETALIALECDLSTIAEALWPSGIEAPEAYAKFGDFDAPDLVAGVRSLHELTDRLMAENERLRAKGAEHA